MVQFIALLIAVALAVKLFWWIVGIVGVIALDAVFAVCANALDF